MSVLSNLVSSYGDDIARAAGNKLDDVARAATNKLDDAARVAANKADDIAMATTKGNLRDLIEEAQKQLDDIGTVSMFAKDADSIAKRGRISELRDAIKAYEHGFDNFADYKSNLATKSASRKLYQAPKAAYSPKIGEMALDAPVEPGYTRLFRGLEEDFDPSFVPQVSDNGFGYESWTDQYNLAKQYGNNVLAVDVPSNMIGDNYITASGERSPIYRTDKAAGLNGISGTEFLLNVNDPLREALTYAKVTGDGSVLNRLLGKK